jgi:hypothetical protein
VGLAIEIVCMLKTTFLTLSTVDTFVYDLYVL